MYFPGFYLLEETHYGEVMLMFITISSWQSLLCRQTITSYQLGHLSDVELSANYVLMSRNKHKKSMCQIDGVFSFGPLPPPQQPAAPNVIVCHQEHHEHTNHLPPVTVRHSQTQRGSWLSNQKTPGENNLGLSGTSGRQWDSTSLKYSITLCMQWSVVQSMDIDLELAWALFHYNQYQQFMLVLLSHSV